MCLMPLPPVWSSTLTRSPPPGPTRPFASFLVNSLALWLFHARFSILVSSIPNGQSGSPPPARARGGRGAQPQSHKPPGSIGERPGAPSPSLLPSHTSRRAAAPAPDYAPIPQPARSGPRASQPHHPNTLLPPQCSRCLCAVEPQRPRPLMGRSMGHSPARLPVLFPFFFRTLTLFNSCHRSRLRCRPRSSSPSPHPH